jgi:UPF0176 protein
MRKLVVIGLLAACVSSACAQPEAPPAATPDSVTPQSPAPTGTTVALPPSPEPVAAEPCPYLDTEFVAEANGQRVPEVEISADEPHPACFFHALDGKVQLTTRVYVGDPAIATALVDQAAPVDTSNPADRPAGWQGGYESTEDGAVYAVAKGGTAVVVHTNQRQSVKARVVAVEVVEQLGL